MRLAAALGLMLTGPVAGDTADGDALIGQDWDTIIEMARGGEVNWFLWGGSDTINQYVSEYLGGILEDEYGITLNRVGLSDTVEAVNIVLGEAEAGVTEDGSVDLIWINGENFRTMVQADLAWCGYPGTLPNNDLIDWDNPSIATDFGVPVDGCEMPWNRAQFAIAYDSARTEMPPRTIAELIDWVDANPGQFTYPAPPDFNGSVFVRHVFYHAAGGVDALLGPFDQALYDEVAPRAWEILNAMEPHLWREGQTYPTSITQLDQLFANSEVAFSFNYDPSQFGLAVESGLWPETVRSYGFADGTIGNTNYTLIPFNSPNKAAALVLQNLLISAEAQLEKARPEVWGTVPAIDLGAVPDEIRAEFDALPSHPSVVAPEVLAEAALPELQAEWIAAIEQGWIENVGR
ncbi:ABC transporter substrate-binding protein [Rhodobacterales bacterium HKCCE3408]|nr:ABC transporter substrate-binding protein [Rhodobacterales bacterium HKCCE3408]